MPIGSMVSRASAAIAMISMAVQGARTATQSMFPAALFQLNYVSPLLQCIAGDRYHSAMYRIESRRFACRIYILD